MIGLLPCAGTAERFNGLPKYLLPCPGGYLIGRHIQSMGRIVDNGIYVGMSPEDDIDYEKTQYIEDITDTFSLVLGCESHETMTQTVLSSLDELMDLWNEHDPDDRKPELESFLFGMPDTYFDFPLVYERLAARLNASNADVVLAVFKARPEQHRQGGMVSVSHNQVVDIVDKPEVTTLQYIWGAMAWRAAFWQCLAPDMPHIGYGVKVALERGLNVQAVICAGDYYDCGTFERYVEMLKANT